jgi:hypothetical protein
MVMPVTRPRIDEHVVVRIPANMTMGFNGLEQWFAIVSGPNKRAGDEEPGTDTAEMLPLGPSERSLALVECRALALPLSFLSLHRVKH